MKGVSKVVWLIVVLAFALIVFGLFSSQFWRSWGVGSKQFSQIECQQAHENACKEWESAGYPDYMYVTVLCSYGSPNCVGVYTAGLDANGIPIGDPDSCAAHSNERVHWLKGYVSVRDGNWWDCIAPGCRQNFDIYLQSEEDCGAYASQQ